MDILRINNKTKIAFFFLIILISFYRSPYILLNGRFIGEEADHHFQFALNNNFFENLFYYIELAGYYNFIPNFFTWVATLVPLEKAPMITVYASFFIILLIPYLVLFRENLLFKNTKQKIIGSFLLFITPPFISEIWLNTLNSQIYLCILSILILFMTNLNSIQKKINNLIILISSFSGIYTCSLLPLFAHKYFKKRNNYNLINLCFLILANVVQLYLILYSKISNKLHSSVLADDYNLDILSNFIYNIFAKSFLGRDLTHIIWNKISFLSDNYNYYIFIFLSCFTLLILINAKKIIFFLKYNFVANYLLIMFFIISIIILAGSLHNQIGGRYAVIPGVILILLVFYFYNEVKNKVLSYFFLFLLCTSLTSGFYEFRPKYKINLRNPDQNYLKYLDCLNCPEWKSEVKIWRKDNDHIIRLWPYPHKQMKLELKND